MARIGSMPSVPDEFVGEVVATNWTFANTHRDRAVVLCVESPGQFSVECTGCGESMMVDVVETALRAGSSKVERADAPVSSILRFVTCVSATTPLAAVAQLLAIPGRRLVAVVDAERQPLGVITPAHVLNAAKDRSRAELSVLSALDVATSGGSLLPRGTVIRVAAELLSRDDRDFALVVDPSGKLEGVVLAVDFLIRPTAAI